jgi:indole-3-glycerol phosphate synthase
VDLDRAKTIYERGFGVSSNSQEKVEKILVCESGIKEPKDVRQMRSVGYNVFLIGEALVTGSDPEKSVAAMISGG